MGYLYFSCKTDFVSTDCQPDLYWPMIKDHCLDEDYEAPGGGFLPEELICMRVAYSVARAFEDQFRIADNAYASHYLKAVMATACWHMGMKGSEKRMVNKCVVIYVLQAFVHLSLHIV